MCDGLFFELEQEVENDTNKNTIKSLSELKKMTLERTRVMQCSLSALLGNCS